jgi:hypothetical protein
MGAFWRLPFLGRPPTVRAAGYGKNPIGCPPRHGGGPGSGPLRRAAGLVFEEKAGVFDNQQSRGLGFKGGCFVRDSLLEPEGFGVDGDRGIGDRRDVRWTPKDVDDVDRERNVLEARVGFFAQDFGFVGIDGHDLVAGGLQVGGDAVGRAETVRGKTDDGDGFGVAEKIADGIGG